MIAWDLHVIWYVLLAILLGGYAVLDGFDLGVGILHLGLKTDQERRLGISSIGPVWDGNEVWLVTFGGALFAAFPEAYATIFSAFYLPFMALLVCLIMRAVSIEFRSKFGSRWWRGFWDFGFFASSLLATFLYGVAIGNGMRGLRMDERGEYVGSMMELLNGYSILVGVLAVLLFALHGNLYLQIKTEGSLQSRIRGWSWWLYGAFAMAYAATTTATAWLHPQSMENFRQAPWAFAIAAVNFLVVGLIPWASVRHRLGQAFLLSCLNILCLVALWFVSLFPDLVTSRESNAPSLTIYNASSSDTTLQIMLWIALLGMPMVIAYTAVVYWTFRGKVENLY